jgi:hypothetical protein
MQLSFKTENTKSSVGQHWAKVMYQMKGLARRNTHVKYESSTTHRSKVITKVKVFEKNVKLQGQRQER